MRAGIDHTFFDYSFDRSGCGWGCRQTGELHWTYPNPPNGHLTSTIAAVSYVTICAGQNFAPGRVRLGARDFAVYMQHTHRSEMLKLLPYNYFGGLWQYNGSALKRLGLRGVFFRETVWSSVLSLDTTHTDTQLFLPVEFPIFADSCALVPGLFETVHARVLCDRVFFSSAAWVSWTRVSYCLGVCNRQLQAIECCYDRMHSHHA